MKEESSLRKRYKSESESVMSAKTNETHKKGDKHGGRHEDKHHGNQSGGKHGDHHGQHGEHHGQHGAHHTGQHGGHHGQHGDHHGQHGAHHTGQHGGHHGQHGAHHGHGGHGHHTGQHGGHHGGHHGIHHGHHGSQHGHHHHGHGHDYDDHHTSSHPIRPRRDTMSRRDTAHSLHNESDRRSTGTGELSGPMVYYENTYKLTPECRIHEGHIRNIITDVLKENITEVKYDPSTCGSKSKLLSEIIKERVKRLNLDRFKIVSMVMIGEHFDQSMVVTSRCLWDQRFDNSVSVKFKRGNIIALGLVFAVYAE